MRCNRCGNEVRNGAKYCRVCGNQVGVPTQPGQQQNPYQQNPYQQNTYQQNHQQQGWPPQGQYNPPSGPHRGHTQVNVVVPRKQRSVGKLVALLSVISALLIGLMILLYFLFLKTGTPEDTIEKLETAMNELDQTALLECFDSQMNDLYDGAMGLGSELFDTDLGALSDLASGLGGIMSAAGLTPTVDIQIIEIIYSSDTECMCVVNMTTSYMGETSTEEMSLPMALIDREWLISMSAFEYIQ